MPDKTRADHFKEIGRKGGETTRDRHGRQHFADAGLKGGMNRAATTDMAALGAKGAKVRWDREKAKRDADNDKAATEDAPGEAS